MGERSLWGKPDKARGGVGRRGKAEKLKQVGSCSSYGGRQWRLYLLHFGCQAVTAAAADPWIVKADTPTGL